MLYKMVQAFQSVNEIAECDHWKTLIEAIGAGLSCDAIYYVVQRPSNFWVCGFWICEVIQLNKGS